MASFCSRLKSSKDAPEHTTKEEDLLKGRSIGAVTPTDASWPGSDSGRYYGGGSGAAMLLSSYRDLHHISNGGGNSNGTSRSSHIFSYNPPFSDSVGGAGYMIGSETGRGSWSGAAAAAAAADPAGALTWPPRSYHCTFCRREFRSAQALGGHMNVHRRDRARLRHSSPTEMSPPPPPPAPPPLFSPKSTSLSSPTTTTTTTTSNSATSNASGIQLQHILRRHQGGGEASPPRTLHLLSPAINGKAASNATGVTKYWATNDSVTRDGRTAAATGLICSDTAAALSLRGGEVRQQLTSRSVKKPCTGILQPAANNYMNNNQNQEEDEEMEAYSGKKMGRRMAAGAAEISLMTAEAAVDLELRLGGAASYARPLLR